MSRVRVKKNGLAWRAIEDEVVVLDLDRSVYLSVNRVGALLWETLTLGASREELADLLITAFAISPEKARSDVDTFVDGLTQAGLVEEVE